MTLVTKDAVNKTILMASSLEYLSMGLKPPSFAIGCIMLCGLSQLNRFSSLWSAYRGAKVPIKKWYYKKVLNMTVPISIYSFSKMHKKQVISKVLVRFHWKTSIFCHFQRVFLTSLYVPFGKKNTPCSQSPWPDCTQVTRDGLARSQKKESCARSGEAWKDATPRWSHEKRNSYFPLKLSWLVNRDPYFMVYYDPYITG